MRFCLSLLTSSSRRNDGKRVNDHIVYHSRSVVCAPRLSVIVTDHFQRIEVSRSVIQEGSNNGSHMACAWDDQMNRSRLWLK